MSDKNISVIRAVQFTSNATEYDIPIVGRTGAYVCTSKESSQGTLYEHELSFKVAGLTPENEALITRLRCATTIRVDDVNRTRFVVDRGELRFKFTVKRDLGGTFGGFRGYEVTVKLSALHPAEVSPF
ncbi:hypothetical protein [uncultured Rikenella sp.]|uniref:hypothetical protein n=1 Tax=uncultured Rikenella sp. TaxID=368003 RepID=UPI002629B0F7|nr:hypothetical protein [uncultured Rikenella sp.]